MKWIALQEIAGEKIVEIVRIDRVEKFSAEKDGCGVVAHYDMGETYRLVDLPEQSEAGKLLAQLNGPVGEVPYK